MTSAEEIRARARARREKSAAAVREDAQARQTRLENAPGAFQQGVTQGITFGWGDELMAAGMTPIEMGVRAWQGKDEGKGLLDRITGSYGAVRDDLRAQYERAQQESPGLTTAGEVGGGLLTALGATGQAVKGAPTLTNIIKEGAKTGAKTGAAYGAGKAEGDLSDQAFATATGGLAGLFTGGVTGAGVHGLTRMLGGGLQTPQVAKDLFKWAGDIFEDVKKSGVKYNKGWGNRFTNRVNKALDDAGFDPEVTGQTGRLWAKLQDEIADGQTDIKKIMGMRKRLTNVGDTTNPSEKFMSGIIRREFDDAIGATTAKDLSKGNFNAKRAAQLVEANKGWRVAKKTELIQDAFDQSVRAKGPTADSFHTKLRSMMNSKRNKYLFTDTEREFMEKAVTENWGVEQLAKFAPDSLSGIFRASLLGTGAGAMSPELGAAVAATAATAGSGAKIAKNIAAKEQNKILQNIIQGGRMPTVSPAESLTLLSAIRGQQAAQDTDITRPDWGGLYSGPQP